MSCIKKRLSPIIISKSFSFAGIIRYFALSRILLRTRFWTAFLARAFFRAFISSSCSFFCFSYSSMTPKLSQIAFCFFSSDMLPVIASRINEGLRDVLLKDSLTLLHSSRIEEIHGRFLISAKEQIGSSVYTYAQICRKSEMHTYL